LVKDETPASGALRAEGALDADGIPIRYRTRGNGGVLVSLSGCGDVELPRAHALMAEENHLVALAIPPRQAPSIQARAAAVNKALAEIGVERFGLLAHGADAELALWMAIDNSERIDALVLMAPIAPLSDVTAQESDLESRMRQLSIPVLALFGTCDKVVPIEMARLYYRLLPKCFTTMVYNATHAIYSDRPEAVASIVNEFLKHREGFVVNRESGLINP
jgi:pimeloyl-ACP methyl ester carboxylesterase